MTDGLQRLAEVVYRHTGIAVRDQQVPSLVAALRRAAPGVDVDVFLAELDDAGGDAPIVARFIDEVTIKETYFYRSPRELEAVPWARLLESAQARGSGAVRVWVSACATGEEAYTLSMLAHEAFGAAPPVTILATDISEAALAHARRGEYSARAVAKLPPDLQERCFIREGQRHVLRGHIKSIVQFRRHNLVADPIPGPGATAFDVVACRNVLIYFDRPTVERVMAALSAALAPGGHLILGAADALCGAGPPAPQRRRTPRARATHRDAPGPKPPAPGLVERALSAADGGDLEQAIELTAQHLHTHPLDAEAHFVHGLAELRRDRPDAAATSLRRALYADPDFGLAAFQLARAHDARGDDAAARRAYGQALVALENDTGRHAALLDQIAVADLVDACRGRLLGASV